MGEQEKEIHCSYPSFSSNHLQPSMEESAFVGSLGFRQEIVKTWRSPRPRRAILRRQTHAWVAKSQPWFQLQTQKQPSLCVESATAPRVLGLAASTIHQGTQQKLHPPTPQVTHLLTLDLIIVSDVISTPPNHPFCPIWQPVKRHAQLYLTLAL